MANINITRAKGARPHHVAYRDQLHELADCLPTVPSSIIKLLPLGSFQVSFLCAIDALGEDHAFGAEILRWKNEYKNKTSKPVNIGQIYGTADRLLEHLFIDATETPAPSGKGRSVITYKVTPLGRAVVAAALTMAKASLIQENKPDAREEERVSDPRRDRARRGGSAHRQVHRPRHPD